MRLVFLAITEVITYSTLSHPDYQGHYKRSSLISHHELINWICMSFPQSIFKIKIFSTKICLSWIYIAYENQQWKRGLKLTYERSSLHARDVVWVLICLIFQLSLHVRKSWTVNLFIGWDFVAKFLLIKVILFNVHKEIPFNIYKDHL